MAKDKQKEVGPGPPNQAAGPKEERPPADVEALLAERDEWKGKCEQLAAGFEKTEKNLKARISQLEQAARAKVLAGGVALGIQVTQEAALGNGTREKGAVLGHVLLADGVTTQEVFNAFRNPHLVELKSQ